MLAQRSCSQTAERSGFEPFPYPGSDQSLNRIYMYINSDDIYILYYFFDLPKVIGQIHTMTKSY